MKCKLILLVALAATLPIRLLAEGTVIFSNIGLPASSSAFVVNGLTGQRVPAGDAFRAVLYFGNDGETNPDLLAPVGESVGFSSPGLFNGGTRFIPGPGNRYCTLQVRVWEAAFGSTYEQAQAAPPQHGRKALLGRSAILRVLLGDNQGEPPVPPKRLTAYGLRGFTLTAVETEPVVSVNNIVVAEGTNGTRDAVFTVSLNRVGDGVVTVAFATADGSATAGSDYVAKSGTLTFALGETTKSVTVSVTADLPPEDDEVFSLNLSNATNAQIEKGEGSCTITEVRVTAISIDVAVSFNTLRNHRYVVEKSDDMVNWSTVEGAASVAGTGQTVTVYDKGAGCQAHRLYRARLLE